MSENTQRNGSVEIISTSYVVRKVALRRLHYVMYASVNWPLVIIHTCTYVKFLQSCAFNIATQVCRSIYTLQYIRENAMS